MQGFLTISQLSKIRKITTETLRHYDRIDLFKPEYIDPETNYRYYSYAQCANLGTILALRKVGMPLQDIKAFLNQKNVDSSIKMLSGVKEELNRKIREMSEVEQMLSQSLQKMQDNITMELNKPFIEYFKQRSVVSSDDYIEKLEDAIYYEMLLESEINGYFPILSSISAGSVICAKSFYDEDKRKLRRVPMILCEEEEKYREVIGSRYKISRVMEGEYLCMYGKGRFIYNSSTALFLREYLKNNGYEIAGDILEFDKISLCVTNDINEVVYRIEIPIKR